MADTQAPVAIFKKGKSRPQNRRKRSASPPAGGASSASGPVAGPSTTTLKSQVILPTRKTGGNLLSAGTKRATNQRDGSNFDDLDEPVRDGPDVKWSAMSSHQRAAQEIIDGDEAEALLERRNKKTRLNTDQDSEDETKDGLYHGQKAYKSHIKKNVEVPKNMRVGPQRNTNSTIKMVTIVDYQPDVCKDYKETGYCGFGDTCKFLHDRGTYLAGWQLDKLAAQAKPPGDDDSDSDSSDDEDIPFACLICRKPYTDPVVTRCGHYYCSACAIKRYAKTPKCLACGSPTSGIFNRADKIIEKMRKKKEADEAEREDDDEGEEGGVKLEGLKEDDANESGDESGEQSD